MSEENRKSDIEKMNNRAVRKFVRFNGKTRFRELIELIEEGGSKDWICSQFAIEEKDFYAFKRLSSKPASQTFKVQTN